ncbi:phosphatidylserine decarboxylase-domain-containing protein [Butyriboletus roseoflavus]|nr:phosphatidylserine decarboxylase-domain-containing protein [Butyriboletus roseoflavus]
MLLHLNHITKPIEHITTQSGLSGADDDDVAQGFASLVGNTQGNGDVAQGIHAAAHTHHPFLHKLVPQLQNLANKYHVGNYVIDRKTGQKFFESMPIYARLGMHLLFCGKEQVKMLEGNKHIEDLLREQSVREGRIYDSPESVKNIPSFIQTYKIALDELLHPDIRSYATFNQFFYRKLNPGARPVENADDPAGICSAADCRLVVYPSVSLARKFWVKGDEFTISTLLNLDPSHPSCLQFEGGSLALFRLAPSDYHRFHSPIDATVLGKATDIPGQYYTVNPQAINQTQLDVFTRNKRSVLFLKHALSGKEVAFVAIGALLVGSIAWTAEEHANVRRGDELGYFAYGGSTVIAIFPPDSISFDGDLLRHSVPSDYLSGNRAIETLMKVGYSLGHWNEA